MGEPSSGKRKNIRISLECEDEEVYLLQGVVHIYQLSLSYLENSLLVLGFRLFESDHYEHED